MPYSFLLKLQNFYLEYFFQKFFVVDTVFQYFLCILYIIINIVKYLKEKDIFEKYLIFLRKYEENAKIYIE